MPETVQLTGDALTIADVWEVAVEGRSAVLADRARDRVIAARTFLESQVGDHTYGVNTGFGRFVSESIPAEQAAELQLRLLRSHACGVGDPYPDEVIRAAMLLRANTLAKGYSGARPETIELLLAMLGAGIVPRVPSQGSVGASGDLAPLAHLALPLVGEGEAWYRDELCSGADALRAAGLEPITLAAKEGLSLINGTQFMTAMASLALLRAGRLARVADVACAMSLEALQGTPTSYHAAIHAARPLPGQVRSAAALRALLADSAIVESHRWCDKVQDAYSLSCAPQVHGASRDLLEHVERSVAVELNAATDNPLVLLEDELIVSNGNFHGQPIAIGARLHRDRVRRAREHQRAADRASRQPKPVGRPASLPRRTGGRPQLRLHDPAVRRGSARLREQGAQPSRLASTRSRRARDRKITCRWATRPGSRRFRWSRTRSGSSRSSCSPGHRRSSSTRRSSPVVGVRGARAFVRTLSDRVREDRPLSADIELVASSIRDGRLAGGRRGRAGRGAPVSDPPPFRRPYRSAALFHAGLAVSS